MVQEIRFDPTTEDVLRVVEEVAARASVVRGVLKPTPLSWYVSEALVWEGAPRTAKEIAAMLDLPRDRVLRVLRGLYEAGAVHRVRVFRDVLWSSAEPLRVQDL